MIYVTQKAPMFTKQMSIEDFLYSDDPTPSHVVHSEADTRTLCYNDSELPERLRCSSRIPGMVGYLKVFNDQYENLRTCERVELYDTFYQEKKGRGMKQVFRDVFATQKKYIACDSHKVCSEISRLLKRLLTRHPASEDDALRAEIFGEISKTLADNGFDSTLVDMPGILKTSYRRIDAPVEQLQNALEELKEAFEGEPFNALYHTGAFAYVKKRSAYKAVKRHADGDSRWYSHYDFENFFGSTTLDFVMDMFKMVYPFSEVCRREDGYAELRKAVELGFLNGGLPQGTKLSPTLTNIMMIPFDFRMMNTLKDFDRRRFVYTRYADDLTITCSIHFDVKKIEGLIGKILTELNAPFHLKPGKTSYHSRSGANWNLGLMVNKDNNITVGHDKKRDFRAAVYNYATDRKDGKRWSPGDLMALMGIYSYYKSVEGDTIDEIVCKMGNKVGIDVLASIKEDLNPNNYALN